MRKKIKELLAASSAMQDSIALHEIAIQAALTVVNGAHQALQRAKEEELAVENASRRVLQKEGATREEADAARQRYAAAVQSVADAEKRLDAATIPLQELQAPGGPRRHMNTQIVKANLHTAVYSAEMQRPEVAAALATLARLYAVRREIYLIGYHPITLSDFLRELADKIPEAPSTDEILQEYLTK